MHPSHSQKSRILDLLRQRASLGLTALESLEQVGTMRLAAYVKFLKDDGHQIDTEIISVPSGKRVARYRLREPTTDDGTALGDVLTDGINSVMDKLTNGLEASHGSNEVQDQELAGVPALQGTPTTVD